MNLKALAKRTLEINVGNGWDVTTPEDARILFATQTVYDRDRIVNKLISKVALMHTEVSEFHTSSTVSNTCEELADVMIRVLDFAYGLEVDALFDYDAELAALTLHQTGYKTLQSIKEDRSVIMHNLLSELTESLRKPSAFLVCGSIRNLIYQIHGTYNVTRIAFLYLGEDVGEFETHITAKLDANAKRGYRHGNKTG